MSLARGYFSSFFLSTLRDYHQSTCIGNSIQREREREKGMFIWTLFINRRYLNWVSYTVYHFSCVNKRVCAKIYLWMDQLTWSNYVIFKTSTWSFPNFTIKQKGNFKWCSSKKIFFKNMISSMDCNHNS